MAFFEKITPILVNKKSDDVNITDLTIEISKEKEIIGKRNFKVHVENVHKGF